MEKCDGEKSRRECAIDGSSRTLQTCGPFKVESLRLCFLDPGLGHDSVDYDLSSWVVDALRIFTKMEGI